MLVERYNSMEGKVLKMDLDVTQEQLDLFAKNDRPLIQDIFPNLSAGEREFLMTGMTPNLWNELFGMNG